MLLLTYISQGLKSFLSMTTILLRFFLLTGSFIFLLCPVELSGQKRCDCPEFASIKKEGKHLKETDFELLKKSDNKICVAKYYEWLAENLSTQNEFDSAKLTIEKATEIYKKENCDNDSYYNIYKLLANINHSQGNYDASLEYSFKTLPMAEASGNKYEEADCLVKIAYTFNRMKQSEQGIVFARRAMALLPSINSTQNKADIFHKLASRYLWYYQDIKKKEVLDSAEQFATTYLSLIRQLNDDDLLLKGYNQMNGFAHERQDYKRALLYIDSSLSLLQHNPKNELRATTYGDKADVLMELGNYKEARRFADSCLFYHKQFTNPETIANAYALIYQISERSENYKDALWAMDNYVEIHDSLTNVEKTKTITELEKKYDQAKNEKTIKELAQEKRIYILLVIAAILALIALAFFIRQQSLKSKQKILETEQRLNRARMNPHFFFNALSSLQSFALQENDGKALAKNLSKFSHIMRETLESTYKEYVTIEQEKDFLLEYLGLQQIRFPSKFAYEINIDENIEADEQMIPSMILQPFIENSIEHGFVGIGYPGNIAVDFKKEKGNLSISIIDNGKGLNTNAKENNEHVSRASQIIKDRIYLLNIKLKTKAAFSINNNSNEKGVTVLITLPQLYRRDIKD